LYCYEFSKTIQKKIKEGYELSYYLNGLGNTDFVHHTSDEDKKIEVVADVELVEV